MTAPTLPTTRMHDEVRDGDQGRLDPTGAEGAVNNLLHGGGAG